MRRTTFLATLVAVATAGGVWFYTHRLIARERQPLTAAQTTANRLRQRLDEMRQQADTTSRTAAELTRELQAKEATLAAMTAANSARVITAQNWRERVEQLRKMFDLQPDQKIPELQLLSALDWLELAQQIPADSSERKARSRVRDFALVRFIRLLIDALHDYAAAHGTVPLADLSELQPYFKPAIDPAILARYEIIHDSGFLARGRLIVTERAPIDEDFDFRRSVTLNGNGGGSGPWSTLPLRQAMDGGYNAYASANNGRVSTKPEEVLPFVQDPISRAIFESMVAYQNDHAGRKSENAADLLPYVTLPAARAMLGKSIRAAELSRGP